MALPKIRYNQSFLTIRAVIVAKATTIDVQKNQPLWCDINIAKGNALGFEFIFLKIFYRYSDNYLVPFRVLKREDKLRSSLCEITALAVGCQRNYLSEKLYNITSGL
jgi:hypothetical protein